MMGVMTTQQLLPLAPAGAVLIGDAAALVADDDGGRVFIRGELCNAWDAGDDLGRRLAAVQLVRIKAATAMAVATAFGVTTVTLWRWRRELDTSGAQGLAQDKRGPKGPSRLTPEVVADIRSRRRGGASLRAIAAAVGVSTFSVRRALPETKPEQATPTEEPQPGPKADLPVLPAPAGRDAQRAAARWASRPAGAGSTGKSALGPGWGSSVGVACSGLVSGRARRTLKVETPTAAAIARSDAPPRRRLRISATTSGVNRDGPLGPRLSWARPWAPEVSSSLRQRHKVTVVTPNAVATAMAVAALMRTSWTAASRRPRSSPASHALHSSPRMNTRPPSSSVTRAAASPIRTSPAGVRGRSCWVVMTPIIPTPNPVELLRGGERQTRSTMNMQVSRASATSQRQLCHVALTPGH